MDDIIETIVTWCIRIVMAIAMGLWFVGLYLIPKLTLEMILYIIFGCLVCALAVGLCRSVS